MYSAKRDFLPVLSEKNEGNAECGENRKTGKMFIFCCFLFWLIIFLEVNVTKTI